MRNQRNDEGDDEAAKAFDPALLERARELGVRESGLVVVVTTRTEVRHRRPS